MKKPPPASTLLILAGALCTAGARAATPVPCEPKSATFGATELACTVPATPGPARLRLTARFNGVHDDSFAGVAVRSGERAIACAQGSRDRIEGDADGDTLACRFELPAGAQDTQLRVQLLWHHAEPAAFEFVRE
jgi:hypothetical protein